jgi:thiamine pyrophosphate-dependent acetolactate synthase large subunit-like protein
MGVDPVSWLIWNRFEKTRARSPVIIYGASIDRRYGCDAVRATAIDDIKVAATQGWGKSQPAVLEVRISGQVPPLF